MSRQPAGSQELGTGLNLSGGDSKYIDPYSQTSCPRVNAVSGFFAPLTKKKITFKKLWGLLLPWQRLPYGSVLEGWAWSVPAQGLLRGERGAAELRQGRLKRWRGSGPGDAPAGWKPAELSLPPPGHSRARGARCAGRDAEKRHRDKGLGLGHPCRARLPHRNPPVASEIPVWS